MTKNLDAAIMAKIIEDIIGDGYELWVCPYIIYDSLSILDKINKWCHDNIKCEGDGNIKDMCIKICDLIENGRYYKRKIADGNELAR